MASKKPAKKTAKKKTSSIWNDAFYLQAYKLARSGEPDARIAKALGVSPLTFTGWRNTKPALRDALKLAREEKERNFQASFRDYVYNRLPPQLQEVWEDLNACEREQGGVARVEAILQDGGRRMRQHFFVYALVDSNFNPSEACRRVNINKRTLDRWCKQDPEFANIVDQIHWHKGNFFEEHLVQLIKDGDSKATIFANRTFNASRGYSEKVKVEHSGQINHLHAVIDIDGLNLPLETRQLILEAVREKRKRDEAELVEVEAVENNSPSQWGEE